MGEQKQAKQRLPVKAITISALAVIVATMAAVHFVVPLLSSTPGTYGDMFGVANALFSGLALGGVILAIVFQSQELELQREELRQTRAELAGQKQQLRLQQETLKKQQFESTFFHHLELFNNIVASMDLTAGGVPSTGRDCFTVLLRHVQSRYVEAKRHSQGATALELAQTAYSRFYEDYGTEVGHYFRTLYNTVRYVDESGVDDPTPYMRLVRAQLSSNELTLLLLNCLVPVGQKFKPLVERYCFLKHVPERVMKLTENEARVLRAEYANSAYWA